MSAGISSSSTTRQAAFKWPGWKEIQERVHPGDTSSSSGRTGSQNFDEGVRLQADLTKQDIGIVVIREDINTADDSAAAKFYRWIVMANGAYQSGVHQRTHKIRLGARKGGGRKPGRPSAFTPEQVEECRQMYVETRSIRRVA